MTMTCVRDSMMASLKFRSPNAAFGFVRGTSRLHQGHHGLELFAIQMSQLPSVHRPHGLVELLEQCQSAERDADSHDAAILGQSLPLDQPAPLQMVEHAGDIG